MLAYLPTDCEEEDNRVKFIAHSDVKSKEKQSNVNLLNTAFWEGVWEAITPIRIGGRIKGGGKNMSEWDRKQMSIKGTACTEMKCYFSTHTNSLAHAWCEERTFLKMCFFFLALVSSIFQQLTEWGRRHMSFCARSPPPPGRRWASHINLQDTEVLPFDLKSGD